MSLIGQPLDFSYVRSPEEIGLDAEAKPGDVVNARGDLLGYPGDRSVMRGMVFVTAEQAAKAQEHGWRIGPASAPERNNGLMTITR